MGAWQNLSRDRRQEWLEESVTQAYLRELRRLFHVELQALRSAASGHDMEKRVGYKAGTADAFETALRVAGVSARGGQREQGTGSQEEEEDGE